MIGDEEEMALVDWIEDGQCDSLDIVAMLGFANHIQ
jgi:hypothetical protein